MPFCIYFCSVINGEFRQYRGSRDWNSLQEFILKKNWKNIETISSWKQPDSIQMSIVAYFFKLSHYLKVIDFFLLYFLYKIHIKLLAINSEIR